MKKGNAVLYIVIGILVIAVIVFMVTRTDNQETMTSEETSTIEESNLETTTEEGVMVGGSIMSADRDIVDNAMNSTDHTTLVTAVQAAGLVDTLKGDGPFTVFAPTNEAFDKLPEGTVDNLLMPENSGQLTGILTYHVVPGEYTSDQITEGLQLTTVNGQTLTFNMQDGEWWINNSARVTIANVVSSNGITHVIDTVLMPE